MHWNNRYFIPFALYELLFYFSSSTMPLEWLFGKRMTPEEMLRKNQRALNKAMRDLDRERARMEQQEKKIITDIKKMAKEGQMVCINVI
jgi:charged multivesicular body protein 2A